MYFSEVQRRSIQILTTVVLLVLIGATIYYFNLPGQSATTQSTTTTIAQRGSLIAFKSVTVNGVSSSGTASQDNYTVSGALSFRNATTAIVYIRMWHNTPGTEAISAFTLSTSAISIINVNPHLPYQLQQGTSANFTLTISAPSGNYTGPLNITFHYQ